MYWTTRSGEKLEIKWMDSVHLWHTHRMLLRDRTINYSVLNELEDRWKPVDVSKVMTQPTVRETPLQLCWVRAIIDTARVPSVKEAMLRSFYNTPNDWIAYVLDNPATHEVIIAQAMRYRLTR